MRTAQVTDGVLVLRDRLCAEEHRLSVGDFTPVVQDGVLYARYPDGESFVLGTGERVQVERAQQTLWTIGDCGPPSERIAVSSGPNPAIQRRESVDGLELEVNVHRTRWASQPPPAGLPDSHGPATDLYAAELAGQPGPPRPALHASGRSP